MLNIFLHKHMIYGNQVFFNRNGNLNRGMNYKAIDGGRLLCEETNWQDGRIISREEKSVSRNQDILLPGGRLSDVIVDDPNGLIEAVLKSGNYISGILWWDRVEIAKGSDIGMGGPRDPRDPNKYFFSEVVHLGEEFNPGTSPISYIEYMNSVLANFPSHDLYPSFSIERAV